MNFLIAILGYNRPNSLRRCLHGLSKTIRTTDIKRIDILISIDFYDSNTQSQLESIAKEFTWDNGSVTIILRKTRLGLRAHVLDCGDYSQDYDGLIMIEDDIYISPVAVSYAHKAIKSFGDTQSIAGISLYSPLLNEMAEMPFYPIKGASDIYLMQTAQSWGQCWNFRMWSSFKKWYEENPRLSVARDMPPNIYQWPDSSWKKYFNKYLVSHDLFFVYPHTSYSTNFTDTGTHNRFSTNRFQVPLNLSSDALINTQASLQRYDSYFEPIIHLNGTRVYCDTYGLERDIIGPCYILTVRELNLPLIKEYTSDMRPPELAYHLEVEGSGLRLYYAEEDISLCQLGFRAMPGSHLTSKATLVHWKYSLAHGLSGLFSWALSKSKRLTRF